MKKTCRSTICILLVLALFGGMAVCLADQKDYSGYKNYVSLGDSIADGIGLPANPLRGPDQDDKELVYCYKTTGAYPVLVAEALGISKAGFSQLGCAGMRTVELRACLDPNYQIPDQYANNFQNDELEKWVKNRFDYVQLVSNADVITLNMCANDIASYALFYLREELSRQGVAAGILNGIIGKLEAGGEYTTALVKLLTYSETLEGYARALHAALQGLSVGYTRWTENWDAIVRRIYELNPDVTLICVGMYNPFAHLKLTGSSLIELGAAADGLVASINAWSYAGSPYANRYIYVDIMGIESMCEELGNTITESSFLNNMELNVHPSVKGHQQIAAKVLAKVPERSAAGNTHTATPTLAGQILQSISSQVKKAVGIVSNQITGVIGRMARK